MRLADWIYAENQAWFETIAYLSPISSLHPPSLKNPQDVRVPTAQEGWRRGDPEDLKRKAREDMAEIHKRVRRQIGKPEVSRTADYPVYPPITKWM